MNRLMVLLREWVNYHRNGLLIKWVSQAWFSLSVLSTCFCLLPFCHRMTLTRCQHYALKLPILRTVNQIKLRFRFFFFNKLPHPWYSVLATKHRLREWWNKCLPNLSTLSLKRHNSHSCHMSTMQSPWRSGFHNCMKHFRVWLCKPQSQDCLQWEGVVSTTPREGQWIIWTIM